MSVVTLASCLRCCRAQHATTHFSTPPVDACTQAVFKRRSAGQIGMLRQYKIVDWPQRFENEEFEGMVSWWLGRWAGGLHA